MRNIWSVAAVAAVVVLCGCQHTTVDQVKASDGMNDWYQYIKDNYPGFQPPPLVSPGISGQTAAETAGNEKAFPADNSAVDPGNNVEAIPVDPVPVQDNKAEVKTEAETAPAAKEEARAEVKTEAKAEAEVKPAANAGAENEAKPAVEPPDPTSSEIYVVKYGDTLGAISKKFYGSVRYVNLLQKANSDIITNANVLKPGMKLIIPKL